jgi:hypothetical protein
VRAGIIAPADLDADDFREGALASHNREEHQNASNPARKFHGGRMVHPITAFG